MTIKTRNRITIFITFISLALLLGSGIVTGIYYFSGSLVPPSDVPFSIWQNNFLTKYSFHAVILSIFLFQFYALAALFYINIEFEKTQASEIIYFAIFISGCLTEAVRLCVPIFDLWHSMTIFTAFCSRLVIYGRFVCCSGLLMTVICSAPEYRQYVEQNSLLTIGGSAVIAIFVPLNSSMMMPTCTISWGMGSEIVIIMCVLLAIAVLSQHFLQVQTTNNEYGLSIGMLLISLGYIALCSSTNYLLAFSGFALLSGGSFIYLHTLHKQYLWT